MRVLIILKLALVAKAEVHQFAWDITESEISPDNFKINSILVDGQFPGPSINAYAGDRVVVQVTNKLERGFTIHWHGIKQTGSVKMDGVPHITQLPISPGTSYTYDFIVDVSGTFWYHAHTGLDSEQAFGALVVKAPKEVWQSIVNFNQKYDYDDEQTILLTEWWHVLPEIARSKLITVPFSGPDDANSHLINGRCLDSKEGPHVIGIKKDKTYRLRLIGATGLSILRFRIKGHKFTVIEVDGTLVEPVEVDYVDVNSGQRYSVLLNADQPIDNYFGSISTPFERTDTDNGVFVLKYDGAKNTTNYTRAPKIYSPTRFIESQLIPSIWYNNHRSTRYYKPPQTIDREIFLSSHVVSKDGLPVFTINDVPPIDRSGVLWDTILDGSFKSDNHSYNIKQGENVQIVIENLVRSDSRRCSVHPWHLHGHSFHVVAHGQGFYNSELDGAFIEESMKNNPILRDTFSFYTSDTKTESNFEGNETPIDLGPVSTGLAKPRFKSCGWYAIRFKADNPGSWMIHCHITHHVIMGLATAINVHPPGTPFNS